MKSFDAYNRSPYSSMKHSTYFDVYDELFKSYIGKPITFLEIGILNGGSLFMWREFFGKHARIIGVDLNPQAIVWREHGFEVYIGNQSDSKFWEDLVTEVGQIDIVLDDGGHTFLQQTTSVSSLLNAIVPNGLIVVEDTHTSYIKDFAPKFGSTFIDYAFSLVHGINFRYGGFETHYEKLIYSIQFFESIVVFKINPEMCIKSVPVMNNGDTLYEANDYRYPVIANLRFRFKKQLSSIKKIPVISSGIELIYLLIRLVTNKIMIQSEQKVVKSKIVFKHKRF